MEDDGSVEEGSPRCVRPCLGVVKHVINPFSLRRPSNTSKKSPERPPSLDFYPVAVWNAFFNILRGKCQRRPHVERNHGQHQQSAISFQDNRLQAPPIVLRPRTHPAPAQSPAWTVAPERIARLTHYAHLAPCNESLNAPELA